MEAACYPVAIVSNALTRRYRSLLFVALAVAYAAVLNVTVLMPSFLVTNMPATTAYDDLRLNFRYVVPGTPDVAALGDFSIPPFHILPGGESVNVVLDHFLYEYDPKALRRFYDYTQSPAYGAIVMLFDADVHGVMKPGLPITYHLNMAYRLKALVRVLKDWARPAAGGAPGSRDDACSRRRKRNAPTQQTQAAKEASCGQTGRAGRGRIVTVLGAPRSASGQP
ncbi:hypothetical protein JL722_10026 [Aureococcus anophagefferens]|nr:hypothetical protein JL722_10026 [Aureococcus anophagefferens]